MDAASKKQILERIFTVVQQKIEALQKKAQQYWREVDGERRKLAATYGIPVEQIQIDFAAPPLKARAKKRAPARPKAAHVEPQAAAPTYRFADFQHVVASVIESVGKQKKKFGMSDVCAALEAAGHKDFPRKWVSLVLSDSRRLSGLTRVGTRKKPGSLKEENVYQVTGAIKLASQKK